MTWTDERPKAEGRYWARRIDRGDGPIVVLVYRNADDWWFAGRHPFFKLPLAKLQWAGPIPEPEDT